MKKKRAQLAKEDNSTAYDRIKRDQLDCSFCPPHKFENANRNHRKHGTKKPKYKNKRGSIS